ncbi:hypothetical protein PWT90_00827 [Aphanocladium album]|nr:hypothetical protein PWT90_00827 [Aphanocladium album]
MDRSVNASVGNSVLGSTAASSVASTSPAAHVAGSPSSTSAPAEGTKPEIKRRAPIACRRCRRMRSKCIHDKAQPPCKACREAGYGAEQCVFQPRGEPDNDRDYRHPRTRAERPKGAAARAKRAEGADPPADPWDNLPPLEDLIDGVNRFTRYYFQLGFIAKKQYPEKLRKDHRSCNLFLLLSILSISARLSPALRTRYGTGVKAADFFMERASGMTLAEIYAEPTLERCQAFYLLSIAQQGSGLRNKSYINMGVAIRMATLMMLHREETYQLQNKTPETIMAAESARRTIWMLHSQDNLHSGPLSPVSLSASDITTLLPCDEDDFANGVEPASRAALEGTLPARDCPALITDKNRSLFATLMQVHHLWGTVGRRAVYYSRSPNPWEPSSQFQRMVKHLSEWEAALPPSHLFSKELLRRSKAVGEDLAYLCVTMMTRLCNIVLRRPYLVDLLQRKQVNQHKWRFFSDLALDLFRNVRDLYEQIDAQFTDRTPDESVGAQIASFCVYSCGLFSTYLCKYPGVCPDTEIAAQGPIMLHRTIGILNESKEVWPLAARWADALEKFSRDPNSMPITTEGSMDDGKDPIPRAIGPLPPPISKSAASVAAAAAMPDRALPLPGTQPGSASSTTLSSPRAGYIQGSLAPNPHPPPPPSHHYSNQNSQPHSPVQHHQPQQNHPHLSQYPTSAPAPMRHAPTNQQQHQPQFGHNQPHHNSPPQHTPAILQPMMSPYTPAPPLQSHQHIPNVVDVAPRWSGIPEAHSLGRQQVDGVGMLIDAFDNPAQQHGAFMQPNNLMMSQDFAGMFPQQPTLSDGFENELYFQFDGGQGANMTPSLDQWMGTGTEGGDKSDGGYKSEGGYRSENGGDNGSGSKIKEGGGGKEDKDGNDDYSEYMDWDLDEVEDGDKGVPEKIEMLMAMDFAAAEAKKALEETGGYVERAVEWLLDHPDDQGDYDDATAAAEPTDGDGGGKQDEDGGDEYGEYMNWDGNKDEDGDEGEDNERLKYTDEDLYSAD